MIILTITLFPHHAVWYQFDEPMDEGAWKQLNERDVSYEKRLSWSETRQLISICKDTKLYDTRKYAFDRDGGVFDGELKINGKVYGVDLTSGLILSEQEIGWLSEKHISWLKLACLQTAIPAENCLQ